VDCLQGGNYGARIKRRVVRLGCAGAHDLYAKPGHDAVVDAHMAILVLAEQHLDSSGAGDVIGDGLADGNVPEPGTDPEDHDGVEA
jgi:hypothetical protein